MDDRILIYSMGRSGGGTLVNAINKLINKGDFLAEPFLETAYLNKNSDYEDQIDQFVVNVINQDIFTIKHNLGNFHYLNRKKDVDYYLFDKFNKIVVNGRRNLLKCLISKIIGRRANYWHSNWRKNLEKLYANPFHVEIDEIEDEIQDVKKRWEDRVSYIENSSSDVIYLEYENFFQEINLHSRLQHLKGVIKILLKISPSEENLEEVLQLLSNKQKMNSRKTYSVIKNIESINKNLGPKYGFLY